MRESYRFAVSEMNGGGGGVLLGAKMPPKLKIRGQEFFFYIYIYIYITRKII